MVNGGERESAGEALGGMRGRRDRPSVTGAFSFGGRGVWKRKKAQRSHCLSAAGFRVLWMDS